MYVELSTAVDFPSALQWRTTYLLIVCTVVFFAFSSFSFSVENAYLEEKEDTCNALGEIAENVGYVASDDCVVMSVS